VFVTVCVLVGGRHLYLFDPGHFWDGIRRLSARDSGDPTYFDETSCRLTVSCEQDKTKPFEITPPPFELGVMAQLVLSYL
jgi:hypothetical protein